MTTSFEETIDWLYSLEARRGMDFRLERMGPVLAALGNPERGFPAILVAGTNGKGSVASLLHEAWTRAGYRCGLYTSPHLVSFRERIRIGRRFVAETDVTNSVERIRSAAQQCGVELTFFEFTTITAFLYFTAGEVDMAVLEVGLGGRLDATNVVPNPAASVIVSVGLDHRDFLGDTLASVAREKAGVARPATPLVTGALPEEADVVISEVAEQIGANRHRAVVHEHPCGNVPADARELNAEVARKVVDVLSERWPVGAAEWDSARTHVCWPGRLEHVAGSSPAIWLDAAHNPAAARHLARAIADADFARPRIAVFGAMKDKDWPQMLEALAPVVDRIVVVPVGQARAADAQELWGRAAELGSAALADSAEAGLEEALRLAAGGDPETSARAATGAEAVSGGGGELIPDANSSAMTDRKCGTVIVTGSIFLLGQLYERICGKPPFEIG